MKSAHLMGVTAGVLLAVFVIPLSLTAQERESGSATSATNPVPFINQPLLPDEAKPGTASFTLTVSGTGFVSGSVVRWNGSARATKFVNGSQLTASIPYTDTNKVGTASVTVLNPAPGGGISNSSFFTVTSPTLAISLNLSSYSTGAGAQRAQTIVAADFNGDGKLDLAVANLYSNTVSVLLGNGDGTFQPKVDYATGLNPAALAVGDFNGDGYLDLAVASAGGPSVGILLGNGNGTFQAHVDYTTGDGPDGIAVGDFNGDGKLDLVTANDFGNANGSVSVLLGNGDGSFQPHLDYQVGAGPFAVVVGDVNGDDRLDLVVANYNSGTVSVLLGNANGSFSPRVDYTTPLQPIAVAVGDFNGDHKLDLAVASFYGDSVSVLLGNGNGTFQPAVAYDAGSQPGAVAIGDFNGDGKLDLAVANIVSHNLSVLLGNGDGTFGAATQFSAGKAPESVAVGDFNGDGKLDLAVANGASSGNGAVSILLQSPTVLLSEKSLPFADQLLETNSLAQMVKLTNTGYLAMKIAKIAITGANPIDFNQTHTCGSSLAAGATCSINVTFRPTEIGLRTAVVTIADSGVGSPQSITLRGTGVVSGPNATLLRTDVTFATQLVGTPSPLQSLTLSNYGTTLLSVIGITASGDFSQINTCGSSLAAGATCAIRVTFKPTKSGTRTGKLSIADNAPTSPQSVSLSGTGTVVKLAPTSLFFACTSSGFCDPHHGGCSAPPQTATLTNTGSATLNISSIKVSGTTASDFIESNGCGATLGAGKSCSISVQFGTYGGDYCGTYTDTLSVSDDGGGSPQPVSLTGVVKK